MKTEFMLVRPVRLGESHYHAVMKTFPEPDRFSNDLTHNLIDAMTWPTKVETEQFLQANAEFAAAHRLYPLEVEALTALEADLEDELDGLDLEEQLEVLLDRS
jgi:hypothetical protein